MEDIPKNLEKEISRLTDTKSRKKSKRWTLLFVNETGKIVPVKRFKGLLTFLSLMVLVSFSVSGVLYFLHERMTAETQKLKNTLAVFQRQGRLLQSEKEKLTARMIAAESRLEMLRMEIEAKTQKKQSPPSAAPEQPGTPVSRDSEAVNRSAGNDTAAPVITEPDPVRKIPIPHPEASKVDIESFRFRRNPSRDRLQVRFVIKNVDVGSDPISGHIFVILENTGGDADTRLILPRGDIVAGKPSNFKDGRHFSIQRFKTVMFDAPTTLATSALNHAKVTVYDRSGELMLEKHFPLNGSGKPAGGLDG